jgi:aldehyde dehydrogenase (NAD+)
MENQNFSELLNRMRQAHAHGANFPVAQRAIALKNLRNRILDRKTEIAEAIYKDFGKADTEVFITEIVPVLGEIKHTLEKLPDWTQMRQTDTPKQLFGAKSYVKAEPKGVVLIISPWNYPFFLAVSPLVSAIAAGNFAVIKPSELSPNTSALLSSLLGEVFPDGKVSVITGDGEAAKTLTELPFDHIFFTGSTQVGRLVMSAAAKNLTPVTLELGGKSPAVIAESAKINDAAQKIVWGKFINAGQTCIAPDYLLAHEKHRNQIGEAIAHQIRSFYGEKISDSKDFARIISERHFDRLEKLTEDAVAKGAKKISFEENKREGRFFAPVLLFDVHEDMQVMCEEIFGPILPVVFYANEKEALQFIYEKIYRADIGKPLAAYVFSEDKSEQIFWSEKFVAGGVCVNECVLHISNPDLPFGGTGKSGIGKSHGIYGFREFSHYKAVLKQRTDLTTAKFLYPPYQVREKSIVNMLLKFFS